MPVMYNTGDWFSLRPGSTYRKIELYNLEWPQGIDLKYMQVCGAPFGGPIALVRDFKQIVPVKGSTKEVIRIVNASGTLISSINWNHGTLITVGWSDSEELLCVQDGGLVFKYDMFGQEKNTFSMGQEASCTKVIDAKIFSSSAGTGVAVMTTNYRIFLVHNVDDPKNRQLPEIPKSGKYPTCWEIVSKDRNTSCIVAFENEIIKQELGQNSAKIFDSLFRKPFKSIVKMAVSYNHRYLALYTDNGIIRLGTTDLETTFCEFDTGRSEKPLQIEWIQDAEKGQQPDAVVIAYPSLLLVVNVNGDQNAYTYDPAIFLIPELDGIRVITNTVHEIIQKVPKCVRNIFAINSQEPASFLFEAHKKFQERSHQSDEYLNLFKDKINVAVEECIEAAAYEFDVETQKSLIHTAYFGKGFIPSYNPTEYIRICRILRVLNALRHPRVSLPLTYQQFCHLKPNVILDRLVFRKHYAIAIQVAKHLNLSESRILEHWAFHKVIYDKNDNEVARKITEKFKNPTVHGVSFCNLAEKAHSVGRNGLAIKLLELETKASVQVPLLLKLGQDEKALYSATKSGDTDLVAMVLLQLKETTSLATFQMMIREFSMAHNLYKKYCQSYSKTALQDLHNLEDDFQSQAEFSLREANEKGSIESVLPNAAVAYTKAHKNIEAELCSEVRKIMKQQNTLSEKYGASNSVEFYGLSIHDTLKNLLELGDLKLAEKFKNEYKIPEKRYWWLRIQVLAQNFRWEELEKFSKLKRSPIGYEPFVEICIKAGKLQESRKYINRCREDKKVKWYIRAGLLEEATETAFQQQDINNLSTIQLIANKANNRSILGKVDAYINQLNNKNK